MLLDDNEKKEILRFYDSFLDTCSEVPEKIIPNDLLSYGRNIFLGEHERIDHEILRNVFKGENLKIESGLKYLIDPDFRVLTYHHNPVYPSDFTNLSSVSQSVYITKTLDCYFELDTKYILDRNIDLDKGFFTDQSAALFKKFHHIEKFYDMIGYLNKGLMQLALRISKVMIAPGVYALVEELVPVPTDAYRIALERLYNEFIIKNGRKPTNDEYEFLKSEAIRLSCDIQLNDGSVIENPHFLDILSGFEDSYTKEKAKFDYIFNNPKRIIVTDWVEYKLRVKRIYGKTWNDDFYTPDRTSRRNIWNIAETTYYDNRANYTLVEQRQKFLK